MMQVTKAVIPAAGFGTRFLPLTKAIPKQMLPIVDKPVVQVVVEELVEAGITDIIFVTSQFNRLIEDHFGEPDSGMVSNLLMSGKKKKHLLDDIKKISIMANFVYVRQKGPYGNGTPLINVRNLVGDEPFLYVWSDDFILAKPSRARQLIATHNKYGCSVLASIRAAKDEDYGRYGFSGGEYIEKDVMEIKNIAEKPGKSRAPSNLANVSGFLLTPDVFDYLDQVLKKLKEGKEFYYNDALKLMLKDNKKILAKEIINGKFYDTGNMLEYLKTVVEFALKDKSVNKELKKYLKELKL